MASTTTATQTIREEEEVRHLAVYLSLRSERESGERERENFLAKSSTFERKSHRRKNEQFLLRHGFFRRKKMYVQNTRTKTTKLGVENRAQHASQRHLSVLKTDSNLASVPRREYHSSCVCVPPGEPPKGILDIAEYIVSRVVFLFL